MSLSRSEQETVQSETQILLDSAVNSQEGPFNYFQKYGFFPWQVSPEGNSVQQEIDIVLQAFPETNRQRVGEIMIKSLVIASKLYQSQSTLPPSDKNADTSSQMKPVYHANDPRFSGDQQTLNQALNSKHTGHGELAALNATKVFLGLSFISRPDEPINKETITNALLTFFIGSIHELGDWYSSFDILQKNDPDLYQEIMIFARNDIGIDYPKKIIPALLELDKFAIPLLNNHKGTVDVVARQLSQFNVTNFDRDQLIRMGISIVSGDWYQTLNPSYLNTTLHNQSSCQVSPALFTLADEFKHNRPRAMNTSPSFYINPSDPQSPVKHEGLANDPRFLQVFAVPKVAYALPLMEIFYTSIGKSIPRLCRQQFDSLVDIASTTNSVNPPAQP